MKLYEVRDLCDGSMVRGKELMYDSVLLNGEIILVTPAKKNM